MSFENQEKIKWPEAGSIPEVGTDVLYQAVEGSIAKRKNAWLVMGVSEAEGRTLVEIWHSYLPDKIKKARVPVEELRTFNLKG